MIFVTGQVGVLLTKECATSTGTFRHCGYAAQCEVGRRVDFQGNPMSPKNPSLLDGELIGIFANQRLDAIFG